MNHIISKEIQIKQAFPAESEIDDYIKSRGNTPEQDNDAARMCYDLIDGIQFDNFGHRILERQSFVSQDPSGIPEPKYERVTIQKNDELVLVTDAVQIGMNISDDPLIKPEAKITQYLLCKKAGAIFLSRYFSDEVSEVRKLDLSRSGIVSGNWLNIIASRLKTITNEFETDDMRLDTLRLLNRHKESNPGRADTRANAWLLLGAERINWSASVDESTISGIGEISIHHSASFHSWGMYLNPNSGEFKYEHSSDGDGVDLRKTGDEAKEEFNKRLEIIKLLSDKFRNINNPYK